MAKQEAERHKRNFHKCVAEMQEAFEQTKLEMEEAWRHKQEAHYHEIERLQESLQLQLQEERERSLDLKVENEILRKRLAH
jgi:hypothetical protein